MEKEKCRVCGHEMAITDTFCEECGFERHIYPEPLSSELKDYEEERVKKYDEQRKKQEEKLKKQEDAFNKVSSQLSETRDRLKQKEDALKSVDSKIKSYNKEIDRLNGELEEERKKGYTVGTEQSKQLSLLQNQLSTAIHEKEDVKRQLNDEQNAHNRTKQEVKRLKEEIERLSSCGPQYKQPTEIKRPSQPNSPKAVIGKAVFTSGSRTETVELYEGLCRVTAPQWTNINGVLFEIDGDKGVYRLRDLNGGMCNRNGRPVSYQGVTTFNNDVFTIGSLTIRLSLPEIDYESLY